MTTSPIRPFGFWTATALVVGGMIGAGIFVLPSQLAPYGWTGVAAWVAGIAGTVLLAWVLSRLAIAMPDAPGGIAITGRVLGPLPGVLIGWSYWVGIWSANAIIALTAVRYLAVFLPFLAPGLPQALGAVVVIWALTLLNLGGARAAGRFQVVTTILKVLPLVLVVLILFALWIGMVTWPGDPGPHAGFSGNGITPALALAFYALVGFESASVAAERVDRPEVNVVRATLAGGILTGLLYIVVCSGVIFTLPEAVVRDAPAPISMFVGTFLGRGAELAVAGFTVIAAVGALNGWILVQGEVPLGMARADLLPRWIGRTNSRDVPAGVLLFTSLCASILILSGAIGAGNLLDFMLRMTAAATMWLYVGACAAALRLGVARIAAVLGLIFCGWVLVGTGREANELCFVLIISAVPLYLLRSRVMAEPGSGKRSSDTITQNPEMDERSQSLYYFQLRDLFEGPDLDEFLNLPQWETQYPDLMRGWKSPDQLRRVRTLFPPAIIRAVAEECTCIGDFYADADGKTLHIAGQYGPRRVVEDDKGEMVAENIPGVRKITVNQAIAEYGVDAVWAAGEYGIAHKGERQDKYRTALKDWDSRFIIES